jgi:hypothetical protein
MQPWRPQQRSRRWDADGAHGAIRQARQRHQEEIMRERVRGARWRHAAANQGTGRRARRAVPPLVVLAAVVALAAPAHADPPTSTGGLRPSQLTIVITDPGSGGPGR